MKRLGFKKLAKMFEFLSIGLDDDNDNDVYLGVNRGGCGYIALRLYDVLSERYPCKIRMFSYHPVHVIHNGKRLKSINTVARNMELRHLIDLSNNGMDLVHVVVEVTIGRNKYLADSTGIFPLEIMEVKWAQCSLLKGHVKYSDMQKWWHNEKGWNTSFDRENLDYVDEIIDRNLAELIA